MRQNKTHKKLKVGKFTYLISGDYNYVCLANVPNKKYYDDYYKYEETMSSSRELVNPFIKLMFGINFVNKFARLWGNYINSARASSVNREFKKAGSVLDIGCGPGDFLVEMQKLGWKAYGTEVGDNLVHSASKKTNTNNIFNGKIDEIINKLRRHHYDAITVWHVLEHVKEVTKELQFLRKLSVKDTKLIVEVPNAKSANFRIFGKYWTHLMAPLHLNFWSEMSLTNLLARHGFRVYKSEYKIHFPFVFVSSLYKKYPLSILIFPLTVPFSVAFSFFASVVKRGDTVRVYAKPV